MNYILFEDTSGNSPVSNLMRHCFKEGVCDFADGNKRMAKKIRELGNRSSGIAYVDTVPDNPDTLDSYRIAKRYIEKEHNGEFVLIPIPCVEYLLIKAFVPFDIEDVYLKDYRSITPPDLVGLASTKSFERYCKSALYQYRKCFHNKFFDNECGCSWCNYKRMSFDYKAKLAVTQVPIVIDSILSDDELVMVDIEAVRCSYIDLYNARKSMLSYGYEVGSEISY